MLNTEFDLLPKSFPKELRHFDAHIYYHEKKRDLAVHLREKAISTFQSRAVFVGRMIDYPIGPHPVPMFEINFPKHLLSEVSQWLLLHRGNLTVLVHEVTGNDERDHSLGAQWMGTPLDLDTSKFDFISD